LLSKQEFVGNVPMGAGVTPHDLRAADFKRILKGFDPAQVTDLLHRAGTEMEILTTERDELIERLQAVESSNYENQKQVRDLENLLQTHERRVKQIEQQLREKDEIIHALNQEKDAIVESDGVPVELQTELAATFLKCEQQAAAIQIKDEAIIALEAKLGSITEAHTDLIAEKDATITALQAQLAQCKRPAADVSSIPNMLADALVAVEDVFSSARRFLSEEAASIIEKAEQEATVIRESASADIIRERKEAEANAVMLEKRIREYSQFLEQQRRDLPFLQPAQHQSSATD